MITKKLYQLYGAPLEVKIEKGALVVRKMGC